MGRSTRGTRKLAPGIAAMRAAQVLSETRAAMTSRMNVAACLAATVCLVATACTPADTTDAPAGGGSYEDLTTLFTEWRDFEAPDFVDGVPDYSADAMATQYGELPAWQARLEALNPDDWPVARQIDWHLVRAEMNGLDFDHRVRRPWARNPAFYVTVFAAESDVPAHEGPVIHGWIDLWTYDYPLSADDAEEMASRIGSIPALLEQARTNLVGNAHDLWVGGLRSFRAQAAELDALTERVGGTSQALDDAIVAARAATDQFHDWIGELADSKTGPSGVGRRTTPGTCRTSTWCRIRGRIRSP